MSKSPKPLPPTSYNLIGGDFQGLSDLARILFDYNANIQEVARGLSDTVDRLAGSWNGQAATSFRVSYGLDADDAKWLGGVAASAGDVVAELAMRLAKIEAQLEAQLAQGVRAGYITLDSSGGITVLPGQQGRAAKYLRQIAQSVTNGRRAATAARKAAAVKLEPQYKALSTGLEKYSMPMTQDPGGLLTEEQQRALSSKLANLTKTAHEAEGSLHHSGGGLDWGGAVADGFTGAGVGATIGGIAGSWTGPVDIPITGIAGTVGFGVGFLKGLVG